MKPTLIVRLDFYWPGKLKFSLQTLNKNYNYSHFDDSGLSIERWTSKRRPTAADKWFHFQKKNITLLYCAKSRVCCGTAYRK